MSLRICNIICMILFFGLQALGQDVKYAQTIAPTERYLNDNFGTEIVMQGPIAAVGSYKKAHKKDGNFIPDLYGEVILYKYDTAVEKWSQIQVLTPDSNQILSDFGFSLVLKDSLLFVGAPGRYTGEGYYLPNAGAVYVYHMNTSGMFVLRDTILPPKHVAYTRYGSALAFDSDILLVGAPENDTIKPEGSYIINSGCVHVFRKNNNFWEHGGVIYSKSAVGSEHFGEQLAIHGNKIAVGVDRDTYSENEATNTGNNGSVEFYNIGVNTITYLSKLVPTPIGGSKRYGCSLSSSGDELLIGSLNGSSAILASWTTRAQIATIPVQGVTAGAGEVVHGGDYLVVGTRAQPNSVNGQTYYGKVSVYRMHNGVWTNFEVLYPPETGNFIEFGEELAYDNGRFLVGSFDSDENEISSVVLNSGAVYAYHFIPCENDYQSGLLTGCNSIISPSGKTWTTSGHLFDTSFYTNGCYKVWEMDVKIGKTYFETIDTLACFGFTYPNGIAPRNASFDTTFIYSTAEGCDSSIRIIGYKVHSNTSIFFEDGVLIATSSSYAYQWLDCYRNFDTIYGETKNTFTPDEEGFYALEISTEFCKDTTTCLFVANEQLIDPREVTMNIALNQSNNELSLLISKKQRFVLIELYTIQGKVITREQYNDVDSISLSVPPNSGVYILKVSVSDLEEPVTLKVLRY